MGLVGQIDRAPGPIDTRRVPAILPIRRKRCAIYARVSTNDQNCDRQRRDLLAHAELLGYEIIAIHSETASGAKNDRQERKKVIALARKRSIDAVLVTELSRWGRSAIDLQLTLEQLGNYGVSLICQNGTEFDLSAPVGRFMAQVLSSVAEFEREIIRERVRSGLAAAIAKGKILGRPPVDTRDRCAQINELRSAGMSDRAIGRKLNFGKSTVNRCPRCEEVPEGMDW